MFVSVLGLAFRASHVATSVYKYRLGIQPEAEDTLNFQNVARIQPIFD